MTSSRCVEEEIQELLASLTEKLEETKFEELWERFTYVKRGWLRGERRQPQDLFELERGPRGGLFGVHSWAMIEANDALHIFLTIQSDEEPAVEVEADFIASPA